MRSLLLASLLVACTACPSGGFQPPKNLPDVDGVIARITADTQKATSFRAETVSDYWLGSTRLKGEVRMMGMPGKKVRFNALSPMGGEVLLDLMCDGTNFVLVDKQNNCVLTGPCDKSSIAQLLHVPLEPDDFFALAVGETPIVPGATGKSRWDSKAGKQIVELAGTDGTSQTIEIDERDGRFDITKSEVKSGDTMVWLAENKGFEDLASEATPPVTLRVPGTSRFRAPGQHSDVIVEWKERELNVELPPQAFVLVPPPLATCGQQPGAPAPAAPAGATTPPS